MPVYDEWNDALIDYLTAGIPRGSTVFLDINDDVLEAIGRTFKIEVLSGWPDDFKRAVRTKVIVGQQVHLENIPFYKSEDGETRPGGVAFLGAMVLAAYYMGEDEEASSINYFKRLRSILQLDEDGEDDGRPKSMKRGSDERLWLEWNMWLQKQGFLPTAQRGEGPKTYINYPISQSLLRQADKDKLEKLFEERNWPGRLDQNIVAARIRREHLSRHLQQIVQEGNVQRFQALVEDIFEVYENWVSYGRSSRLIKTRTPATKNAPSRNLNAGLYRVVDPLKNTIDYCLHPRQPRRGRSTGLAVRRGELLEELIEDESKWYRPLWKLSPEELEQGAQYELVGSSEFHLLILPRRDFWILTLDPDYPESGIYVSGEPLDLGTSFILLCKQELQNQITRLKNERLVQWRGDPYPLPDYPGWIEYRDMMVLSEAWSGVSRAIENQDLYESLRPLSSIGILFEGGMRVPRGGAWAWLENYEPKVRLAAFDERAYLQVQAIGKDDDIVLDKEVPTNALVTIPWPGPGEYVIAASVGAKPIERMVQILSWSQLTLLPAEHPESIRIGAWNVSGALVRLADGEKN